MRTTVNVDEALLTQAKELAARTRRSLGEVIEDALRVLLAAREPAGSRATVVLPVYGGSGLRPGVDLDDKESLAALLDEGPAAHAAR